jgi:ABC-type nitrate/sulfonate/bicarbonate transport system ATPase subunit
MAVSKIVQLPTANRARETHEPPSSAVARRHHATELVVRNVSKSFNIDRRPLPVLQDISLVAQPGQFITIVGASGCGKSTLLRLIAGLDRDFEGEILFGGRPVSGPSLDRGLVFQDHRLFPWLTIEQNIASAFSSRPIDTATKRLLVKDHIALVGLNGFEKAYPHQVSGGMAQRAAIARALVNEPDILLLDEPLGAVDALTRLYLQEELQRIWLQKGVTMIMVTHDIEEAVFLGDQVIVLQPRPGRISKVIDVGLTQPRDREDSRILKLKKEILGEFHNPAPINYSI